MERKFVINFEFKGDTVLFNNNVSISKQQYHALTRVRGFYTDSTPSFIWQSFLQMPATETELTVQFSPFHLKRFRRELDFLSESGMYKMEASEVVHNNRKKIEIHFTEIHPALLSIVHLM